MLQGNPKNLESIYTKKNESSANLMEYYEEYKQCTSRSSQLMLIGLANKKGRVKVSTICDVFKVKRAFVHQAIKYYESCGPCAVPKPVKIKRNRLNLDNVKHFFMWLTTYAFREVAYGTTTLKYDSGKKTTICNSLMDLCRSQAIKQYQIYCEQIQHKPLSYPSLYRILHAIKPKTRRRITGADNFLVLGVDAFQVMSYILRKI